ncbi:lysine transporter LysE [Salinivibrio sp. ML323]|uniref:LysE family translocator n=1 Tax=Salinivibrio TaxID=51366 RepID=UPI000984BC8B|nr:MULTISPECIES: LysE family translocator [Salinivibrio]OOE33635.1 lysine transporter LysE [Salinivibrio kushneri]OOE59363.1 lysine transporter LysE [Salinivibrio sp. ML323]OOE59730.1 lysine transporter LysE [Salinivibrio sp. IB282]OOE67789.1 lysine transporter LysE [Salinivibrio kushneri]WBA19539.1 LysE family translocator [Salinivibrio kushneri]
MIDPNMLPVYLTAVVALLLVPGPDMLLIVSASLSYGRRVGMAASLGNATSGLILTGLAATGVSAMIAMSPTALTILQYVGAAYLLKMSIDMWRASPTDSAELAHHQGMGKYLYKRAVMTNLLNPKALLFFVLFLPQFISQQIQASSSTQLLTLGLLLNILGLVFNLLLVAIVGKLGNAMLTNTRVQMYQHKIMALVFAALAAWLFAQQSL